MKNCNEIAESLLRRRNAFEKARTVRRKTVMRISGMVCSLALVLFIGAGVGQGWWITGEPELPAVSPTQPSTQPIVQGPTTSPTEPTRPSQPIQPPVTEPVRLNNIVINEVDSVGNSLMYIALMRDDFVPMTEEELTEYYGAKFVPEVPDDLVDLRREAHLGIYRRDGGTGDVYHDEQHLTWTIDEVGSRGLNVTMRKNQLPYQFFALSTEDIEASVIRDVEVNIGRTESGTWLAEFLYKDVGFRIVAEGITQEELVDVIESLLD